MSQKFIKIKNKNQRSTAYGTVVQKFAVAKNLVKDIVFEEAKEYAGETSAAEQG